MLQHCLSFLSELIANNNKPWFDAHRDEYRLVKQEFETFIDRLIGGIRTFDPTIGLLTAKDCTYRIYRDVRFSPDKTPYKNHLGAYIAPGGRKSTLCGYYFHLEPASSGYLNHSLWAGGFYCPDAATLKALRTDIFEYIDEYKSIIHNKDFLDTFRWFDGNPVKTAPKGFPKDFPDIDLIKPRDFSFYRNIDERLLESEQILDESLRVFQKMLPYNKFVNRALEYHRSELVD